MRAFLLSHATSTPLPCHRAEGLGASLTLHLSLFAALASAPVDPVTRRPPTLAVTFVSQVPLAVSEPTTTMTTAPTRSDPPAPGLADGTISEPALALPDFEFDVTKIAAAERLFPFLIDTLPFLDEAREKLRPKSDRLVNPFGRERRRSTLPPLAVSDLELQAIVDRAWSRRERWKNFEEIADLLSTHDPDDGSAYLLMRRYLDHNLLQPYYDSTSRDPRFWVMLGLAADHERLIGFIGSFVRRHPSSHTTTELLFMLDEFAQASRDTLLMLLSTDPRRDLDHTRDASLDVFQLATGLHGRYESLASDRGLRDTKSVRLYFDDVRLRILRTIVETTPDGYGATDARFLAGRIMWDQNRVGEAVALWNDLSPDARGMYALSASEIRRELAFRDEQTGSAISRILGAEYRRWLTFSEERLRDFGYEFDTF